MRKIINTKHYSSKQLENMTYNLREKFNRYCSMGNDVSFDAHIETKKVKMRKRYFIYREIEGHIYCNSWQELQLQYHKLMEERR